MSRLIGNAAFTRARQQKASMNDHQRRQEELQKAKRHFLQAAAQGKAGVLDRFGNRVEEHDRLFYAPRSDLDILWEVKAVGPNVDPGAPAGAMNLVLFAMVPLGLMANTPSGNIVIVGKPDSKGETDGRLPGDGIPHDGSGPGVPDPERGGQGGPGGGDRSPLADPSGSDGRGAEGPLGTSPAPTEEDDGA